MNREYLWMITVTAKKRNYILTHEVYKTMHVGSLHLLIPFCAVIGCERTVFIIEHSKKIAFKVFLAHINPLARIKGDRVVARIVPMQNRRKIHMHAI